MKKRVSRKEPKFSEKRGWTTVTHRRPRKPKFQYYFEKLRDNPLPNICPHGARTEHTCQTCKPGDYFPYHHDPEEKLVCCHEDTISYICSTCSMLTAIACVLNTLPKDIQKYIWSYVECSEAKNWCSCCHRLFIAGDWNEGCDVSTTGTGRGFPGKGFFFGGYGSRWDNLPLFFQTPGSYPPICSGSKCGNGSALLSWDAVASIYPWSKKNMRLCDDCVEEMIKNTEIFDHAATHTDYNI